MVKSTRSLMGQLQDKDVNPALANVALCAMQKMFQDDLLKFAKYCCNRSSLTKNKGKEEDLVQEAWIVFYQKAGNFNCDKKPAYQDDKILFKVVRNYLSRIIMRKWLDEIRKLDPKLRPKKSNDSDSTAYYKLDPQKFSELLRKLSKVEYDIMYTDARYFPYNIPRAELERLVQTHQISRGNIRVIRYRILKKMRGQ